MKATLITTGKDMQINLEADTKTERLILAALKEGAQFTVVGGSNIELSRGGTLRYFAHSAIHQDSRPPEAIALLLVREGETDGGDKVEEPEDLVYPFKKT